MAVRECSECYYYEKCDSEDCPPDKPPHGFCYVNPPMTARVWDEEQEMYVDTAVQGFSEVMADRPGCRFWEQ